MKNNILAKAFNKSYLVLLMIIVNTLAFAQKTPPPPPPMATYGAVGPGAPDQDVSVDMYEGLLLVVVVMFIVGMCYYNKRRKLA